MNYPAKRRALARACLYTNEIIVPDFQTRKILLYLLDMYNYLSQVVSIKNKSKDIFNLFFNEILKKVKRNVENFQVGFTIIIFIQKFIDKTSSMVVLRSHIGCKRSHRTW